jgi:hypothetical protein
MTLIAGFYREKCPVLMGDLLISSSDNTDMEICLPTVGRISNSHLTYMGHRPTSLCQKVNLLSPQLAIAWADKKLYARAFMQEIINTNLHHNPTYDSLRRIFNEIEGQGNLNIIGIYRNGHEMCIFDFNARSINTNVSGFEYIKAAGTGYDAFSDFIPSLEDSIATSGQLNKLEKGIATAVNFSTALLGQEIESLISLNTLYGAGYEIAHPLGSGLAKFCNITYLFWSAKEEIQNRWTLLPFPFLSSNYSYHKDILIIRSVRISGMSPGRCRIDSDELHVIKPIYRIVSENELIGYMPASLNCNYLCNVFLWENYQGHRGAFATFGSYSTEPPPVIWENEFKSHEGIKINKRFVEESISKIAKRMKQ